MKKIFKLVSVLSLITILSPIITFAQTTGTIAFPGVDACSNNTGLLYTICKIQQIFNAIIPVLIALGVVYFVWGVVQYFISDNEEAKKGGRDRIVFGIIGLAVILGVWGLVNIVTTTFGVDSSNSNTQAPSNAKLNLLLPH